MPNQLNFPDQISVPYIAERPDRISQVDRNLFEVGNKQVVFGTSTNDVIETWVYDSNGAVVGHLNVFPTDDLLNISTVIDNSGSYEFVNVDLGKVIRSMNIETGRYGLVLNFFRDEVGSEAGQKLYIADINSDRTELKLYPKDLNNSILNDIYEWVVPSVPRWEAQALIDQTFGKSTDALDVEKISAAKIKLDLNLLLSDTSARLDYSDTDNIYESLMSVIIDKVHTKTLEKMSADNNNIYIQEFDLQNYIKESVSEIINEMKLSGQIDNRFEIF